MRARIKIHNKLTGGETFWQDEVPLGEALNLMKMAAQADSASIGYTALKEVTTELHFPEAADRLVVVAIYGTEV